MLNIYGPINNLGYGIHCQNMIKALDKLTDVALISIGDPQMENSFLPLFKKVTNNRLTYNVQDPSVFIYHDQESISFAGTPALTFSIFETTLLTPASINALNRGPTDIVLTTTKAHKEILIANKVDKPIEIIHEGVDPEVFNIKKIPFKSIDTKDKFVFLMVGKNEKRKNTDKVIRTFLETCLYKDVALICHTFNPFLKQDQTNPLNLWTNIKPTSYGLDYKGFIGQQYHEFSNGSCSIYFTTPNIPIRHMADFYSAANVGIQCSSGEGWDLPLCEMMACGLPVITTDCIGHTEFLPDIEKQNNLTIKIKSNEIANDDFWFKKDRGEWGVVEEEDIREKIDYVINNQNKFKQKDIDISNHILNNFTWDMAAKRLLEVIKDTRRYNE